MIDAIVLAAGLGTRMGQIKPLIDIDGEPALGLLLRRLRALGVREPIVVLGHSAAEIREAVHLHDARVLINPRPEGGLSGSLRTGLDALAEEAVGVLVLHADMPFVAERTIRSVLDTVADSDTAGVRIIAPAHNGRRGFPVYFSRACIPELREALRGDAGARNFIARHADRLTLLEVDDPGCSIDLDTPGDLAKAKEMLHALPADR